MCLPLGSFVVTLTALLVSLAPALQAAPLLLFEDTRFRGESFELVVGDSCLNMRGRVNDVVSSVRLRGPDCVVLCAEEFCRGACVQLTLSVPDLTALGLNDKVSSLRACPPVTTTSTSTSKVPLKIGPKTAAKTAPKEASTAATASTSTEGSTEGSTTAPMSKIWPKTAAKTASKEVSTAATTSTSTEGSTTAPMSKIPPKIAPKTAPKTASKEGSTEGSTSNAASTGLPES